MEPPLKQLKNNNGEGTMVILSGKEETDQIAKMNDFNSSDDELENPAEETSPLKIDWLDLESMGCDEKLGICALPGCRYKDTWRSLASDICYLKNSGVQDVFSFCTKGEFVKYRVTRLLQAIEETDITVHHFGFLDGSAPSLSTLLKIVDEVKVCLLNGRKTVIHCLGGLGRSCLVAVCLMMILNDSLESEEAIKKIRELRGPGAIQSVKQYNFVNDFRKALADIETEEVSSNQSVSR